MQMLKNDTNTLSHTLTWLAIFFLISLSACAQMGSEVDPERFQVNPDETVLDNNTELMWAEEDSEHNMTWLEAEEYCTSYGGAGHQDWRMPTTSELAALLEAGILKNEEIIRITGDRIWATETDDSSGAFCSFHGSGCGWIEKVISISLHALPVRDTGVTTSPASSAAAPIVKPQSIEQRLQMVDLLHKQQLITREEYDRKRASILNEL